ncbi:DUF4912 domain-containing protein [Limnoraphis robusta Tam1]|uniref:DUF4912 domain-containing protein n=1 Tax=Limnoraphis robusta TaxID=1118279 RepID=UPI002B2088BE|nr:DUF4912 domain-containing protein [Limnoraphis robusta]MEA5542807.1 DUF4912 domain-containing protein [Limnoraphis robusta Tam1]
MVKERPPLEEMTLRQLRKVASEYGISRYSRMRKSQLLASIQEIEHQRLGLSNPSPLILKSQEEVEAAKFSVGLGEQIDEVLSSVDEGLIDLPIGYGLSRIVLMARDPEWAYAYWDVSSEHKEELRRQGGQQLALRIYDVTKINLEYQTPHSIQEYPCDELAREWYVPIPVSDREYVIEIGYRCADGRWLTLARSAAIRIPPIYPSEWIEDQFITVSWNEELQGKIFAELTPPTQPGTDTEDRLYKEIFGLDDLEAKRVAGSLFGSMHQVPSHEETVSSYVFPSGVGQWASGIGERVSGIGLTASGVGLTASGVGLTASGVGLTASGVGLTASGVGLTAPRVVLTASGVVLTAKLVGATPFECVLYT